MARQTANLLNISPATDLPSRARAIGKSAAYLAIALLSAVLISAVLKSVTGRTLQELMRAGPLDALLAHTGLLLALVFIPTFISLRVWKEPFAYSGWSAANGGKLMMAGIACGAGLMMAFTAVLWLVGAWSGTLVPVSLEEGMRMFLVSALLWLVQAAHEEGLHRGYAFVQLSKALSFWPATVILSLWFVWGHVGQEGATTISLATAGLFALVLAYSFLRTRSLWFAFGFHAAWNFMQSFILGFANSGGRTPDALTTSSLQGPPLITGGIAGPEGSVLALFAIVALVLILRSRLMTPKDTC